MALPGLSQQASISQLLLRVASSLELLLEAG